MSQIMDYEDHPAIPLVGQRVEELEKDVEHFRQSVGLDSCISRETLFKGAMIAKKSFNLALLNLSEQERQVLEEEELQEHSKRFTWPRWITRGLLVTILVTACAAITQGWQQSTINGSTLFGWEEELGVDRYDDKLLFGIINAAPWISGSLVGTWLSDPLQDLTGRRPALFFSALLCIVVVIGTAQCNSWKTLLLCRCLLGLGIGSKASIAPVFAAEAAPDQHRGKVLMMWQLFDTLYVEAYKSLLELRGNELIAARDLYGIHAQLQVEATNIWRPNEGQWSKKEGYIYQRWVREGNFFTRMGSLFMKPRTRRACVVASIVMLSQQLCGINVLAFYSSNLINSDKVPHIIARIEGYNLGFGLANFVFTIPVYFYIDDRGRRYLLLFSFTGMLFSLAAVAALFKLDDADGRLIAVSLVSILCFVLFYSVGAGPIPFTLSAEVFPLHVRDVGMSFCVMINFLFLGLLVFAVPSLTTSFGHGTVCGEGEDKQSGCDGQANLLGFFTGLNFIALVLIFLLVPDTHRQSLESMNDTFNDSTMTTIRHHCRSLKPSRRGSSSSQEGTELEDGIAQ